MKKHEAPAVNDISRISAGTEVKGNLVSKSDIRIDGSMEGDLTTSGKLVVGEKAFIKGNVICQNADVWGSVEGELCVKDTVAFKTSASFNGNLKTGKICIELGAKINGNVAIINQ